MGTLIRLNQTDWNNSQESTKMVVVGADNTPSSRFWSTILEGKNPESLALFLRVLDSVESSNRRLMDKLDEVNTRCSSLEGQILVANHNFERTKNIPERLQRVERFVWAATAVAAFLGVVIGGVGQRMISDALIRKDLPPRNEERFDARLPARPHALVSSP